MRAVIKGGLLNSLLLISSILFIVSLALFSFFLGGNLFFNKEPTGDEGKYLKDLQIANEFGLENSFEGASITYLTFSYLINKIVQEPLLALKLTSFLFGTITFFILYFFLEKYLQIKGELKIQLLLWILYLFVIQATLFSAVSDMILHFFSLCFFIFFLMKRSGGWRIYFILGIFFALMLATRQMAGTYIFVFFLCFLILAPLLEEKKTKLKQILILGGSTIFFLLLINSYNLYSVGRIAFEEKELNGSVNWAQWDYHNAILIDKGIQERYHHVNITETEKYLKKNGMDSLPSTFLEMIKFNPILTIKEFFIDSFKGIVYMVRQTGLFIFLFLIFFIVRARRAYNSKIILPEDFLYLFCTVYFFFICFIVISNIQPRWFMAFLPVIILVIGKDLSKCDKEKQKLFAIGNNLFFVAMTFPYLFEKLNVEF